MFWVAWSGGVIRVGKGSTVDRNITISYVDPNPSAVNYFALSGWAISGNVKVCYS